MRRRAGVVAVTALVAAAWAGCAKVGPPVAPEVRLPRAVSDLTATVSEGAVDLAWTNPSRRVDNTIIRDLAVARVYRTDDDGTGDPKSAIVNRGRVAGYREIARIAFDVPEKKRAASRAATTDRGDLAYGRRYTYVVLTEDGQGRTSLPSPRVSVLFIAPPETPRDVTAEPGDGQVRLHWRPPARLVDGTEAGTDIVYEVLRSGDAQAPLQSITPTPITATELVDRNLDNDRAYTYAVRAVRRSGTTLARGAQSAPVSATPLDLTPPGPPTNLVAVATGDVVRLSWTGSPDADVALYIVYRAMEGAAFVRIGAAPAPSTTFLDRDVAPGRYRYVVTAQDRSSRANESGRSNEVRVNVP
ncbi:MAG TPA: hypothetical protein VGL09_19575 [Methylomirabilota bacterium]